jgi:hypothetical protein
VGTAIGVELARTGLGQRAAVATSMAGAVTWYSGMRVVDLMGLANDELSGREPLTPARYWDRVEAARPDVFLSGYPPASPGYEAGSDDPVLQAPSVAEGVRTGWGSEITRLADRARLREMRQREMIFIRDHYFFGGASASAPGTGAHLRVRDSPLRSGSATSRRRPGRIRADLRSSSATTRGP